MLRKVFSGAGVRLTAYIRSEVRVIVRFPDAFQVCWCERAFTLLVNF